MLKKQFILLSLIVVSFVLFTSNAYASENYLNDYYATTNRVIRGNLVENQYTISGSSWYSENYDYFTYYDVIGYTPEDLVDEGYETVIIHIYIDIKEINEGYQYIHVASHPDAPQVMGTVTVSHGGITGSPTTSLQEHHLQVQIPVRSLANGLCIRYSAIGNNYVWQNSNLRVTIALSYTSINQFIFINS